MAYSCWLMSSTISRAEVGIQQLSSGILAFFHLPLHPWENPSFRRLCEHLLRLTTGFKVRRPLLFWAWVLSRIFNLDLIFCGLVEFVNARVPTQPITFPQLLLPRLKSVVFDLSLESLYFLPVFGPQLLVGFDFSFQCLVLESPPLRLLLEFLILSLELPVPCF